jgi:hypothetical protein
MNQPDLVDAAAAPYVFGALGEYYPHPIFDAVNETAFTLAPTSMGTFTNLTIPPNYAYPVSNQSFDCEH